MVLPSFCPPSNAQARAYILLPFSNVGAMQRLAFTACLTSATVSQTRHSCLTMSYACRLRELRWQKERRGALAVRAMPLEALLPA